jgi:Ca2+-binding RTX toxin-like protein
MSNIKFKVKVKGTKKKDNIEWEKKFSAGTSIDVNSGAGDDIINYRESKRNTKLFGGTGNDTVNGGKGNDYISGGKGNDKLYGNDGNDTILGGRGNDTIKGGKGDDIIKGGKGNDIIKGGKGDDIIYTGFGVNTINIAKGDGNDIIYHQGSKTTIDLDEFDRYGDMSFSKNLDDLEMTFTHYDGTQETITFKNYFENGKIVSDEIYFKTPVMQVVPMYGIPFLNPPVEPELQEVMEGYFERLKYAPPPFLGSDDTAESTDVSAEPVSSVNAPLLAVTKYATPLIFQEPEIVIQEPIMKYAPPPIYGYTSDNVKLSTLLNMNGLTITEGKNNKYKGTDFDDTITGSDSSDTILAGKGNDKIHAQKGNDVINAGKGINILYFSKNDGKNTVLNGKGTDILIIEDEKIGNLKAKYSGNNLVIKYTGGEIILKDYKKGGHSAQYIQAGNTRKEIDSIISASKTSRTVKNSVSNNNVIENVKSETTGWLANSNDDISNVVNTEGQSTDNINVLLGNAYTDKLKI